MTPAEDLARLRHYMTDTESPGYGQGYDAKGHTTTPAEERRVEPFCTCTEASHCTNDYPGCDFCRTLNSESHCPGEATP